MYPPKLKYLPISPNDSYIGVYKEGVFRGGGFHVRGKGITAVLEAQG